MPGDGRPQRVRVGCAADLSLHRLQTFLGALYGRDPDIHAEVIHDRTAALVAGVRDGRLDIALIHGPTAEPLVEAEPVFPGEPLAGFLPLGHRLAHRPSLTPADLRRERLLTFPAAACTAGVVYAFMRVFGTGSAGPIIVAVLAVVGLAAVFVRRVRPQPPVEATVEVVG